MPGMERAVMRNEKLNDSDPFGRDPFGRTSSPRRTTSATSIGWNKRLSIAAARYMPTYLFNRGTGVDSVRPDSVTARNDDVVRMGGDILPGQVELRKAGNNIEVTLLDAGGNATDAMVLVDYLVGGQTSGKMKGRRWWRPEGNAEQVEKSGGTARNRANVEWRVAA